MSLSRSLAPILQFAAIEPSWTRLAVPVLGVSLFAVVVGFRQRRAAPAAALVALTVMLDLWLFGAGLVWSKRYPSMIRWSGGWVNDPSSWEWTALLGLAYVAIVLVGVALRAFSEGRHGPAWAYTSLATAAFAAWTSVVRYSLAVALVGGALVLIALLGDALTRPTGPVPAAPAATTRPIMRALAIVLITAFVAPCLIALAVSILVPTGG